MLASGVGGAPSSSVDLRALWQRWRENLVGIWDYLDCYDTGSTRAARHEWGPGNMHHTVLMRIIGNNIEEIGGAPPFSDLWRPLWDARTAPFFAQDVPFLFRLPWAFLMASD